MTDETGYVKHDAVKRLWKFLNAAGGEGYVLDGVDGGDLFMEIFDFEDKIDQRFALAAVASSALATEGGEAVAQSPFIGMDREWTPEEKQGMNNALRQYGWTDAPQPQVGSKSAKSDKQEAVYQVRFKDSNKWMDLPKADWDLRIDDNVYVRRIVYGTKDSK